MLAGNIARADSFDAPAAAGWSTRTSKPAAARPVAGNAGLKWRTATEGVPYSGRNATASDEGPKLHAPRVARALHEVDESGETGAIQLLSLSTPADDPADDPFQDEVVPDEEGEEGAVADGEEPASDEDLEQELEFDADEFAQREGMNEDASQLPGSPRLNLRQAESELPTLGEEYAEAGPGEPERCPSPRDLKPINQIDHRIAAEPGLFPQECALSEDPFQPRNFTPITFTWKASSLCHKPLYFEQPKLERYGHTFGLLTPIISAGTFFVTVPCLPYLMGVEPPWECVYPLGWYRPGSCAPYTVGPFPLSIRGAATQGVITTGLWFLFP